MAGYSSAALVVEVRDRLLNLRKVSAQTASQHAIELVALAEGCRDFRQEICHANQCFDCFAHCAFSGADRLRMGQEIARCCFK